MDDDDSISIISRSLSIRLGMVNILGFFCLKTFECHRLSDCCGLVRGDGGGWKSSSSSVGRTIDSKTDSDNSLITSNALFSSRLDRNLGMGLNDTQL